MPRQLQELLKYARFITPVPNSHDPLSTAASGDPDSKVKLPDVSPTTTRPSSCGMTERSPQPYLNNLLFCRVPINSVLGFIIRNLQKVRLW